MLAKTLYDKLWQSHLIEERADGTGLLYIDRHLLHEVTSPQAFSGLKEAGRSPWRVQANFAVPDHNVPTTERSLGIQDPIAKQQLDALTANCHDFSIPNIKLDDIRQGIVHIIGPEQGLTLPGMTIVCGDSHTSTHGALGALAFGIGTSDVEHVLATQCLAQKKMRNFSICVDDALTDGLSAKDLILAIIGEIGTAGGTGYAIEYRGKGIEALSIEGRMTLCNMTIEAGARAGLVAVDDKTIDYIRGRPFAPKGQQLQNAQTYWQSLHSDAGAVFEKEIHFASGELEPQVTWGTSPEMVLPISGHIPDPEKITDTNKKQAIINALNYMNLKPGMPVVAIQPNRVFIGSCTNARIEDLRAAAAVVAGRKKASNVKEVLVVPGSGLVKQAAEAEGLHEIFKAAGFSWREPGCSMCLAMNADKLLPGEHCAATSNRNFEGRQGQGGRTHLMSPQMAAAAAVTGHLVDARELL